MRIAPKAGRYDPANPAFRKACIRERLAEIKDRRDAFSRSRDEVVAAAQNGKANKPAADKTLHPYRGDNDAFRIAYIRYRMVQLKDEREQLIAEREAIEATIESSRKGPAVANGLAKASVRAVS